jgi:hypothetical protein
MRRLMTCLALAMGTATTLHAQQEIAMTARGTFDVAITPLAPADSTTSAIGRFSLEKQYHGDLDATAHGIMLAGGNPAAGSAGYVAMEQVTGTLNGRSGSFMLQHSGTMDAGAQALTVQVVPSSGTGELAGISGQMTIIIEGKKHSYVMEYRVP